MKNAVIIKGNRYGISIVLNETMEFSELLDALRDKLSNAEDFFDSEKQLAVAFEGRRMSNQELDQVLDIIKSNSKLNIQYVMDENSDLETTFFDIIQADCVTQQDPDSIAVKEELIDITDFPYEETLEDISSQAMYDKDDIAGGVSQTDNQPSTLQSDSEGMFYRGTLRSGQSLEAKESIVIVGDVNPGATVIAGGNIVVIGALKGNAIAGGKGNRDAFVMALSMEPIQIQIADVIARCSDRRNHFSLKKEAMVAVIIDNQICIDSISKSTIQDIHF